MHRRQYIPGSHVKVSRRELAKYNAGLRRAVIDMAAQRQREHEEEAKRQQTGIRGFINRVKRTLTEPIAFGRKAS